MGSRMLYGTREGRVTDGLARFTKTEFHLKTGRAPIVKRLSAMLTPPTSTTVVSCSRSTFTAAITSDLIDCGLVTGMCGCALGTLLLQRASRWMYGWCNPAWSKHPAEPQLSRRVGIANAQRLLTSAG